MVASNPTTRPFAPGSSGWCVADLDEPQIARQWEQTPVEMLEGVLVQMGAAYFDHSEVVGALLFMVKSHLRAQGRSARVAFEVDLIADEDTIFKADGMLILPEDVERQHARLRELNRDTGELGRIRIAPTLIVESVSEGHERHDYVVKREWYARLGVPNYWIVNYYDRSLLCLRLQGEHYIEEADGQNDQAIEPGASEGVTISLKEILD